MNLVDGESGRGSAIFAIAGSFGAQDEIAKGNSLRGSEKIEVSIKGRAAAILIDATSHHAQTGSILFRGEKNSPP